MKTIREIALEEFTEMLGIDGSDNAVDFAESVLQQYLEQQEPIGFVALDGEFSTYQFDPYCLPMYLAPPIKPGFVMVPLYPSFDVTEAAWDAVDSENITNTGQLIKAYTAMIQAAQESSHD